eukprot:scaffold6708_cov134-Cylindrotheca_fusiformis.AAC.36
MFSSSSRIHQESPMLGSNNGTPLSSPNMSKHKKRVKSPPSSPSALNGSTPTALDGKKQSMADTPNWRKEKVLAARSHRRSRSNPTIVISPGGGAFREQPAPSPQKKGHRKSRSSITLPTPPPRPPLMDSSTPTGIGRKRLDGHAPPMASSSPRISPRKSITQKKRATAPAPPQNAIQRLSVKLSQSRKEKKAEKKERQERLLQ